MDKLGQTTTLGYEDQQVCVNEFTLSAYYTNPANKIIFGYQNSLSQSTVSKTRMICPHMLSIPPDCVVFYVVAGCTPGDLYAYVAQVLSSSDINISHCELIVNTMPKWAQTPMPSLFPWQLSSVQWSTCMHGQMHS